MVKGETVGRGGAGGEDYHHGQVILGRQPHKNQFGGQHPEFPQPRWDMAQRYSRHTRLDCFFFAAVMYVDDTDLLLWPPSTITDPEELIQYVQHATTDYGS